MGQYLNCESHTDEKSVETDSEVLLNFNAPIVVSVPAVAVVTTGDPPLTTTVIRATDGSRVVANLYSPLTLRVTVLEEMRVVDGPLNAIGNMRRPAAVL